MTNKTGRIGVGLLTIALTAFAFTAHAATSESISGSNCQSTYPPDTSLSSALYHNANSISNQSTGWRYVSCPLQRVAAQSTAGWNPAVVATDNTNQLWCAAASLDEWGNYVQSVNKTIPAGTGARLINWPNMSSAVWGYFNVNCVMPANSSVQQILASEF
jgi:hypothetical protein